MTRRPAQSLVANPVLVGAVTTLVVVVAVFLAYNANQGLPFVPTTQLKVELANGSALLPGNDVREGGYRIGIVDDMRPVRLAGGKVGAVVTLKLDKDAGNVPIDSEIAIRPRSLLGLKYAELRRGRSTDVYETGDTVPVAQTKLPVELHDFQNIFDEDTRDAARGNLKGFGDAFSGRGASLNRTIEGLPRLLRHLEPVMRTLGEPSTGLRRFFRELGDFTRVVSPVAARYSHSFTAGADTFEAWSRCTECVKDTLERSAPTMRVGIKSFQAQRPFLTKLAVVTGNLRAATAELPRTLPRIIPALRVAQPVLRDAQEVYPRLRDTLASLRRLAADPLTLMALTGLRGTGETLNPTFRFLGPYITVCNYFNYAWTHVSEHLSEVDPTGTSQRTLLALAPRQRDSPGSTGAAEPANGEQVLNGNPAYFHTNFYSAAVDREGNADCESGQRGYAKDLNTFGDQTGVPRDRFDVVMDPHIPGSSGPTSKGRARVLPGQTFSRAPEQGPQMPAELDP